MTSPLLHYAYDPLCGWCYAAAPMVDAVNEAGIALSLHGGGLWATPTKLRPEKGAHIRESDARIAAMTGQHFGAAYTAGLLSDPATIFWSQPTVAAVLAAGSVGTGADLAMLHAIQVAHYVDGRRVVETDTLAELGAGIGLDPQAFGKSFDLDRAADHIKGSRAFMDRLGLHGFPSFVLEAGSALIRIPHESHYGRPEAFVEAVTRAARQHAA